MDATRLSAAVGGLRLAEPAVAPQAQSQVEPPLGVHGLLFELPGVLYEASVWRRWLLRQLARRGLQTQYDAFYEVWDNEYLADVNAGRRTLNDALAAFLLSANLSAGLVDEVIAAAGAQLKNLEADPRLLSGVAATLNALSGRGFVMAITADSDEPAGQLSDKLAKLGVAGRFCGIVSSRDLKAAKPEPICYLAPLRGLGLAPADVAFVGIRPAHLAGARAVGMKAVALANSPCEAADRNVRRFDRLPEIVESPRRDRRAA